MSFRKPFKRMSSTKMVVIDEMPADLSEDSSSVATETAHPELTPSPKARRLSRGRSSRRFSLLRRPEATRATSLLFIPSLELEEEDKETKESIWNTKFMRIVCASVAAAIIFNNAYFLYVILVEVTFETGMLLAHWAGYFSEDPYVRKALREFSHHQKQVMKEVARSKNGGFLRRRQEIIMAGVSFNSTYYWQDYFSRKASLISERATNECKRRVSLYSPD